MVCHFPRLCLPVRDSGVSIRLCLLLLGGGMTLCHFPCLCPHVKGLEMSFTPSVQNNSNGNTSVVTRFRNDTLSTTQMGIPLSYFMTCFQFIVTIESTLQIPSLILSAKLNRLALMESWEERYPCESNPRCDSP